MSFRGARGGAGGTGLVFAPPASVVEVGDTADVGISNAILRADARWSFPAAALVTALRSGGVAELSPWYAELTDLAAFVPLSQKGAAGGVATLDAGGLVPVLQLPYPAETTIDGGAP